MYLYMKLSTSPLKTMARIENSLAEMVTKRPTKKLKQIQLVKKT